MAINEALSKNDPEVTFRALQNPNAVLQKLDESSCERYHLSLYASKTEKTAKCGYVEVGTCTCVPLYAHVPCGVMAGILRMCVHGQLYAVSIFLLWLKLFAAYLIPGCCMFAYMC